MPLSTSGGMKFGLLSYMAILVASAEASCEMKLKARSVDAITDSWKNDPVSGEGIMETELFRFDINFLEIDLNDEENPLYYSSENGGERPSS
jgi:hypothetical protein